MAGSGTARSSSQKAWATGSTGGASASAPFTAAPDIPRLGVGLDAEQTARQLGDRVEGEHAPVGERAGRVERHAGEARDELVTEAALPRAPAPR